MPKTLQTNNTHGKCPLGVGHIIAMARAISLKLSVLLGPSMDYGHTEFDVDMSNIRRVSCDAMSRC